MKTQIRALLHIHYESIFKCIKMISLYLFINLVNHDTSDSRLSDIYRD